jgi:hypothetical protein
MNNSGRDEAEMDMDIGTSELSECLLNSCSYPEEEQQVTYQSAEPARLSTNHSAENTKQTSTTEATGYIEGVHPQRQSSNEGTDRTLSSTNHSRGAETETSQQMQLHHSSESPSKTVGKSADHSSESISSSHNGLVSKLFSSSPSSAMVSETANSSLAIPEPVHAGHSGAGGWTLEPVVPHSGHSSGALEPVVPHSGHSSGALEPARRGECWCPLPSREPPCGSCVSWLGRTEPHHRLSALTADSGCGLVSVPEDALLTQVPVRRYGTSEPDIDISVADPGSGAFLTPGSGIPDPKPYF